MKTTKQQKECSQLEQDIRDFRAGKADASEVFKRVEGKDFDAFTEFVKEKISKKIDTAIFCCRYVLFIIQDCHLGYKDEDLILAALGLLTGYETLALQQRHKLYCQNVGIRKNGVDMPLYDAWKDIHKSLNNKENRIIKMIETELRGRATSGKKGYAEDDAIISKIIDLTFPKPHYLDCEGYRKCEVSGKTFYIPITEEELKLFASTTKIVSKSELQSELTSAPELNIEQESEIAPRESPPNVNPPVVLPPPLPVTPGWGDNGGGRPSYTMAQVDGGILGNQIVFNSISNSVIGNEKNFVGVREDNGEHKGAENLWDSNYITVEDGKVYIIRLYVHNNNPNGMRAIAKNVRAAISIPTLSAQKIQVTGFIESSNATPSRYWASVVLCSDEVPFHLEYNYGSACLENNELGKHPSIKLSDDVVTRASSGGVLVNYDTLDGSIPGCYQYASYISIRVRVVFDKPA